MLENFVHEAFTAIDNVAKPVFNDIAKEIDQVIEKVAHHFDTADDTAPAHFAAGYLFELTGEDYHDYIVACYTPNSELTDQMQTIMDFYAANDRASGDDLFYSSDMLSLWDDAMANCPQSNAAFGPVRQH